MFVDPCIIVQFIQKNPKRCNRVLTFIIQYLYKDQHISGDTPPIIKSLKLHWQPLVLHTWKVVGRVVAGCCQALPDSGLSPETCWASYKYGIINFDTLLHLVGFFCTNSPITLKRCVCVSIHTNITQRASAGLPSPDVPWRYDVSLYSY